MWKLIALALTTLSLSSYGANKEIFVKYGVGINTEIKITTNVKMASLGFQQKRGRYLIEQFEMGLFTDSRGPEYKPSTFGFYGLGIEVNPGPIFLQSIWSVGGISNPDSVLGGKFQFSHDFTIGVKDREGKFIGIDYKHISSAGIEQPNVGRDFLSFKVGVKF